MNTCNDRIDTRVRTELFSSDGFILPLSRPRLVPTHTSIGDLLFSPEDAASSDIVYCHVAFKESLKVTGYSHAYVELDPSHCTRILALHVACDRVWSRSSEQARLILSRLRVWLARLYIQRW